MNVRHIASFALLVLMAVAALFFFPVGHGSYSATHGPITALRASRLRVVMLFVISAAAAVIAAMVATIALAFDGAVENIAPALDGAALAPSPIRC